MKTICDKCCLPIDDKESAMSLSVEVGEMPPCGKFLCSDRHIRCSPSRAQYIKQLNPPVVDERPQFDKRRKPESYVARMTDLFSSAYERLQNQVTK